MRSTATRDRVMFNFKLEDHDVTVKVRHRNTGMRYYSPCAKKGDALAWLLRSEALRCGNPHFITKIAVVIVIRSTKKVSRGDIDNYVKLIYDSLQKACIVQNDRLVREEHVRVEENVAENSLEMWITGFNEKGWTFAIELEGCDG